MRKPAKSFEDLIMWQKAQQIIIAPLQGFELSGRFNSQGVALGYTILPFQGISE